MTKTHYLLYDTHNHLAFQELIHYGYDHEGDLFSYGFTNDLSEALFSTRKSMTKYLVQIQPHRWVYSVPIGYKEVKIEDLEVRKITITYKLDNK